MLRVVLIACIVVLSLSGAGMSQVDIADPGESGFGVAGSLSFASNMNTLGGTLSYTIRGIADFLISYATVGGDNSGSISGFQFTFLPVHATPDIRWSFGFAALYQNASIDKYKGQNVYGIGPLLTLDIPVSPVTDFQLGGAYIYEDNSKIENGVSVMAVNGTVIVNGNSSNFFLSTGASIPSNGGFTTFSFEFGLLFKVKDKPNNDPNEFR